MIQAARRLGNKRPFYNLEAIGGIDRMSAGLLEKILIRRYGQPNLILRRGMIAKSWKTPYPEDESLLYMGMKWKGELAARFGSLQDIYGDACGGYLLKNILKVAVLISKDIYGLWNVDELRAQPDVHHAVAKDPSVDYFMDEVNVRFFGIKKGQLYVFDAEFDELYSLGPIEPALHALMDQWEAAGRDVRGY
jgi:hypothetical protein